MLSDVACDMGDNMLLRHVHKGGWKANMVGQTIAQYFIIEKIGEGGMGVVYKARDTNLNRLAALKFLRPDAVGDAASKKRFIREAQTAASLEHPNICTVYGIHEVDGLMFIAMAYIDGMNLEHRLLADPVTVEEAIDLAIQISDALHVAHTHGVIHRDIKGANIMLTRAGLVKITDFGLARSSDQSRLTQEGSAVGTIAYMSPEHWRGETADQRTDIWALGILLYQMMTGRLPFHRKTAEATMFAVCNDAPPPMPSLPTEKHLSMAAIIEKALTKNPDERYQNMAEVLADLMPLSQHRKPVYVNPTRDARPAATSEDDTKSIITPPPGTAPEDATRPLPHTTVRKPPKQSHVHTILWTAAAMLIVLLGYLALQPRIEEVGNNEAPPERSKVAVVYFDNNTGSPSLDWLSRGMPDILINSLSVSTYFHLISVEHLYAVLQEMENDRDFIPDRSLAVRMGKQAEADYVITGSLMKTGDRIRIIAQIHDLKNDRLVKTEQAEGDDLDRLLDLSDQLTSQVRVALEIEVAGEPELSRGVTRTKTRSLEAYRAYIQGMDAINQQTYEDAIGPLTRAVQIDSTFAHAYEALTNTYYVLGEYRLAQENIVKALRFSDRLSMVEQLRIRRRERQLAGDRAGELDCLQQLVALQPDEAEWHFLIGYHYWAYEKLYPKSEFEFLKAIALNAKPQYYNYLGYMYLNWGKNREAVKAFETYAAKENTPLAHDALGTAYMQAGDYDKAQMEFEAALRLKADFLPSIQNIGFVHAARYRFEESRQYHEQYLAQISGRHDEALGHFFLGEMYMDSGRLIPAENELRKSLRLDATYMRAYAVLGEVALKKGEVDSADVIAARMERVLQETGKKADEVYLHYLTGKIHHYRKAYTKSVESYQKALLVGAVSHAHIYDAMAEAYAASGDLPAAIRTYKKVFEYNPSRVRARYNLGKIYEQQRLNGAAIREYEQVRRICKNADEGIPLLEDMQRRLAGLKATS